MSHDWCVPSHSMSMSYGMPFMDTQTASTGLRTKTLIVRRPACPNNTLWVQCKYIYSITYIYIPQRSTTIGWEWWRPSHLLEDTGWRFSVSDVYYCSFLMFHSQLFTEHYDPHCGDWVCIFLYEVGKSFLHKCMYSQEYITGVVFLLILEQLLHSKWYISNVAEFMEGLDA